MFAKSRKPESRGTLKIIQDAYRTVGMRGLYTGLVPMLFRYINNLCLPEMPIRSNFMFTILFFKLWVSLYPLNIY